MKHILLIILCLILANNANAVELKGSYLEYSLEYSDYESDVDDKTGELNLYLDFGDIALKYNNDVTRNNSEADEQLDIYLKRTVYDMFEVSVNAGIQTFDNIRFGLDITSDDTYVKYMGFKQFQIEMYPFDFGTDVGDELETLAVTRLFYLDGRPSIINASSNIAEIRYRDIPGIVFVYKPSDNFRISTGIGALEFDYPANSGFNIEQETTATVWKKELDIGYKFGISYENDNNHVAFDFIGHSESKKTGAMLEYAAALTGAFKINSLLLKGECVFTKAGKKPWFLDYNTDTHEIEFAKLVPYEPLYTNDWVDENGFGIYAKIGYEIKSIIPFLSITYLDENFIYDDDNSAHELRTLHKDSVNFSSSASHGGLVIYKTGLTFSHLSAKITPFYKYEMTKNRVFSSGDDLTAKKDERTGALEKTSYTLGIDFVYEF